MCFRCSGIRLCSSGIKKLFDKRMNCAPRSGCNLLPCMSPVLALLRRAITSADWSLSESKRTRREHPQTDAIGDAETPTRMPN